jgi:hypothetical protein
VINFFGPWSHDRYQTPYWRRKQQQWRAIAERAPDDATADYLHNVFEPTARAIDGLEKALAGLAGLPQMVGRRSRKSGP